MGKFKYDETDGYTYISDNGLIYDLLEGKALQGKTTSDIVFVMLGGKEGLNHDEFIECIGDYDDLFVNFQYGADTFTDVEYYDSYFANRIKQMVDNYELTVLLKKHPQLIESTVLNKIWKTVDAYLTTNKDVLEQDDIDSLQYQLKYLKIKGDWR